MYSVCMPLHRLGCATAPADPRLFPSRRTASGISVNAPDGGVTNHGVISGTGLTAWELDKNKGFIRGTITGCNGTAVFAFQQGDAYYDATNQGKGRLYVSKACFDVVQADRKSRRHRRLGSEASTCAR